MFILMKSTTRSLYAATLLSGVILMGISGLVYSDENNLASENAVPQFEHSTDGFNRMIQLATPKQECSAGDIDEQVGDSADRTVKDNAPQQEITVAQREQCLITVEKAQNLWQQKKLLFVDVRPTQAYRTAHISGALNIPEHTIKTRMFLKKKFIVLVNNGHSLNEQIISCVNLKAAGFARVSVLQGGIHNWSLHALLQGDAKLAQIDRLSAPEFNQAQLENDWVIVDVSKPKTDISALFPSKTIIQDDKKIQEYLAKPSKPHSSILVVGADVGDALVLTDLEKKNITQPVYYLNTSIHDYRDYVAKHNVMLSKLAIPKRVKRCGG